MTQSSPSPSRDPRVDLLRGFSLLCIFVDHIPGNRLADFTLHNFGFSDAAELFVILAGFSATFAYGRVFDRMGARAGLAKVLWRCLQIYSVQVALLLSTLLFVTLWTRHHDAGGALIVGPLLRDGVQGAIRGIALRALPTYLDILPLYIILLASFPLIRFGLSRSLPATLGLSVLLYGAANVFHWDLPNVVDPAATTQWYFNPFTWQLVFVLGIWFATAYQAGHAFILRPPALLRAACWAYVAFAFVALDAWKLWPAPFGTDFPGTTWPFAILGNEPKSFVTPWRLIHVLAVTYLALTSPGLTRVARMSMFRPIVSCGRKSLQVFALGCLLALIGRLVFRSADVTALTQILVNAIGIGLMLLFGFALDRARARPSDHTADGPAPIEHRSGRPTLWARARAAALLSSSLLLTLGFGLWPLTIAASADQTGDTKAPAMQRAMSRPADQTFRIVAFGSSSTQGVGATSPSMTYPAQVERIFNDGGASRLAVSVLNRGIGGEDIDDMLKRLQSDVLAQKPDLVIWQVGSNDSLRGVPLDRFKAELRGGIATIRAGGADVLLMEPQWCPAIAAVDATDRFVAAVRDVGGEQHVDVLRRYDLMRRWMADGLVTERTLIGPDGLHMTDRGYTLLAKAVVDEVSATSVAFRRRISSSKAASPE